MDNFSMLVLHTISGEGGCIVTEGTCGCNRLTQRDQNLEYLATCTGIFSCMKRNFMEVFRPNIGQFCGPGSSVGIGSELRAGRSRIEFRWGRDFPPLQTGPGTHPSSCKIGTGDRPWDPPCKIGTGSFPGVKCGRGVLLNTHPLLVPRSWNSRAIPLPTVWATPDL